jgi:hypothetical protein
MPDLGIPLEFPIVSDVKMPWFMLGVIYTSLFFLLQNRRGS